MLDIIQNKTLAFIAGIVYLIGTLYVFFVAHKRGKFSFILIIYEYFFIVGLGISAIFLAFGYGANTDFYRSYILSNRSISDLTFWHLIFYSLGMVFGMAAYVPKDASNKSLTKPLKISSIDCLLYYKTLIGLGILFLLIYVFLAGPQVAFTTSATARAGDREGLEELSSFLFFKNIAQIGGLSLIFFPLVLVQKKNLFNIIFLLIYGLLLYSLTGARAAISDTIFFALVIYMSLTKFDFRKTILLTIFISAGLFFVMYGKGLGDDVFSVLFGQKNSVELRDNDIELFIGQFNNLIFSIDAGIKNFDNEGPFISKAILLAPLGFMPSWLFDNLGLQALSWQHLESKDNIVCLNTMAFPLAFPCTVPPYYVGVAAYLGSVVFGFVFGFVKFYFISMISIMWKRYRFYPELLWKPLILFILLERLTLFIPNVIGLFSFIAIIVLTFLYCQKLLRRKINS